MATLLHLIGIESSGISAETFDSLNEYVGPFASENEAIQWLKSQGFTQMDGCPYRCLERIGGRTHVHTPDGVESAERVHAEFVELRSPDTVTINDSEKSTI